MCIHDINYKEKPDRAVTIIKPGDSTTRSGVNMNTILLTRKAISSRSGINVQENEDITYEELIGEASVATSDLKVIRNGVL